MPSSAASHLPGGFAGRNLNLDFSAAAFFVATTAASVTAAACRDDGAGGGDAAGSSSWWYVSFRGLGLLALLPLPATDYGDVGGVEGNGDDVSKNVPLPSLLLFWSELLFRRHYTRPCPGKTKEQSRRWCIARVVVGGGGVLEL